MNSQNFEFASSNKFKWSLSVGCGLFLAIFLIVFQPFGVNNYQHESQISTEFVLAILSFGVVVFLSFSILSFAVQPRVLNSYSFRSVILWIVVQVIITACINYLYYEFLAGFRSLSLSALLIHIFNIATILTIPIVAVTFLYFHKSHRYSVNFNETMGLQNNPELLVFTGDYKGDEIALNLNQVFFLESHDNYVAIHFMENNQMQKHLLRSSLSKMEEFLNQNLLFVRCNRSVIVNLARVTSFKKSVGKFELSMIGSNDSIQVSKSRAHEIMDKLKMFATLD